MGAAEPFAETLKPCGERSLVRRKLFAIILFACVVGHAFDTRDGSGKITIVPPPKAARTILTGVYRISARLSTPSWTCPSMTSGALLFNLARRRTSSRKPPLADDALHHAEAAAILDHSRALPQGDVRWRRSSSMRTVSGGAGATPNRGGVLCSVQQQGGFPSHEEGITLAGRQRRKGTLSIARRRKR